MYDPRTAVVVRMKVRQEPGGGGHAAGLGPELVHDQPDARQQLPLRQPAGAACAGIASFQ